MRVSPDCGNYCMPSNYTHVLPPWPPQPSYTGLWLPVYIQVFIPLLDVKPHASQLDSRSQCVNQVLKQLEPVLLLSHCQNNWTALLLLVEFT